MDIIIYAYEQEARDRAAAEAAPAASNDEVPAAA